MTAIEFENITILVTGAAGFIGSNTVKRLLQDTPSCKVIGIDNLNDYYDVSIKKRRLEVIDSLNGNWLFKQLNIANKETLEAVFQEYKPTVVVNLAAQPGIRYSIINPDAYIESNIIGFYNVLECCRKFQVSHLVYASSSSVYGSNNKLPFSIEDKVDSPVSLYAATKKSNEIMAHAYSKLYNIPCTGLRFFTVYGPNGRPDMAYSCFAEKMFKREAIQLFNNGKCRRDFTYIDDVVEGLIRVMHYAPEKQDGTDGLPVPPYKLYNIGNSHPVNLMDFVTILKEELIHAQVLPVDYQLESYLEFLPMQQGDVPDTYADITALERDFGFKSSTPLRNGLRTFAEWFAQFIHDRP